MMKKILTGLLAAMTLIACNSKAEIPPDAARPCFPGAFYRKAVSSLDLWTGIDATVVLPHMAYDATRIHPKTNRPMDNASVYLGGNVQDAKMETDIGLSWEVIRLADGSVSNQRAAFRPFWRTNQWFNAPARPDLYFLPGDTVRLILECKAPGEIVFTVEPIARTEESWVMVESLGGTRELKSFTTTVEAALYVPGEPMEFKRVNGLDQTGNEGKPALSTRTILTEAQWTAVYLLRGEEKLPFDSSRYTDMRCPNVDNVVVTELAGPGAETVTLKGY